MHEWKVNEAVMSTRQSFVLLFPRAVARLARLIEEPDGDTALKAIMVCLKYMLGDKTVAEGVSQDNELAHVSTEQLVARAQRTIAALQQPPTAAAYTGGESGEDAAVAPNPAPPAPAPGPQQAGATGLQTGGEGAL